MRSLRGDARERGIACREALLIWLATDGRGAVSADLFVKQDAYRFYDTPFTVDEVNEAGKFLVDTGLVRAIGVWGPDIVRPVLTAKGQQCVEFYDGDVRAFLNPTQPGGSVTNNQENNFYAEGAQAAQGQNVTQTQNNAGIDAAALAAIFQAMRDALSSVADEDDRGDVEHAIQELEVAAEDGDPDEVEQHAGRLQRLASRVGGTALTAATTVGVQQVLQALGSGRTPSVPRSRHSKHPPSRGRAGAWGGRVDGGGLRTLDLVVGGGEQGGDGRGHQVGTSVLGSQLQDFQMRSRTEVE